MRQLFIKLLLVLIISINLVEPAYSARDTNSFDGNIFPIYAGNGSLVPPASTLEQSLKNNRTSVLVFYLDDSATSKSFAPVVSGLKLLWNSNVDIIPLTTDEIQDNQSINPKDASYYWHGNIPQIVIINPNGDVVLDRDGQVPIDDINAAISLATGIEAPEFSFSIKSYNEYNSEASKEGYSDPR